MIRPAHRILAVLLCALTAGLAAPATAATKTIKGKAVNRSTVTFNLAALGSGTVRKAHVRSGSRRTKVAAAKVRRALKTKAKRLRVRVPRPRRGARTPQPVLVVDVATRPAPQNPVTPGSPDDPADAGPTAPAPPVADPVPVGTALVGGATRAAGSAVLADAAAAEQVVRSSFEPRAVNATANNRIPTADELTAFRAANSGLHFESRITGAFTGTTDEILQWASHKWGIDADVLRAVATTESWWRMSEVGDNGVSFGLMQIKRTVHHGTWPLSAQSTSFNVDYYGAIIRQYYDGHATWVMDVEHGADYTKGDLWGAVGAHYAGRWYTQGAKDYIAKVQGHLDAKTWRSSGF